MRVVLDTCIFVNDYQMRKKPFRILLYSLCKGMHTLHLPQTVVKEVKNKHREELNGFKGKDISRVMKVIKRTGTIKDTSEQTIAAEIEEYVSRLESQIQRFGVSVGSSTCISADEIINASMQRTKPMSGSDRGVRDMDIWHYALDLAIKNGSSVAFVTANSNDFLDKSGAQFHPDLLADMSERSLSKDAILPFNNLASFVSKEVEPHLSKDEQELLCHDWDILSAIEETLDSKLKGYRPPDPDVIGLSSECQNIIVQSVEKLRNPHIEQNIKESDTAFLLHLQATVDFSVTFFENKYVGNPYMPSDRDYETVPDNAVMPVRVNMRVSIDASSRSVSSLEIVGCEPDDGRKHTSVNYIFG